MKISYQRNKMVFRVKIITKGYSMLLETKLLFNCNNVDPSELVISDKGPDENH